ncbi:uncharacterized protein LOC117335049 [Pecten maximus]|uniref:uncharacterized protein LOC117335049 n=1 Tax=Pecten maximus TaxID=6579 RepID=UPI001458868B|nr:uncharacterized protein LOC117335049 [Pecten maximus]
MVGPFTIRPIPNLRLSPVGVVPKSDGKWRLITHLSYPAGKGVNSYIPEALSSVKYSPFDNVIEMVSSLGKEALLAKMDIKSAFRLLPVFPGDFDLLGLKVDNQYFIDKCLPMGCSISCRYFENFSTFLHWLVIYRSGINSLDHYLDDFLFAGKRESGNCEALMLCFSGICEDFGIPIAHEKTVGPVTVLVFLGLQIVTVNRVVRIPQHKAEELHGLLLKYSKCKKITKKELESLVGSLCFYCRALKPGPAFLRRFYDELAKVSQPHHFIRVHSGMREDMDMWLEFLETFDGQAYFQESTWLDSNTLQLYTDSAGSAKLGCGAFFAGKWVFFPWPIKWEGLSVLRDKTFLEFISVILSLMLWGLALQNKHVRFRMDNIALVSVLNTQSSKSHRLMFLVRVFVKLVMHIT